MADNFSAGVMTKLGFDYATLRRLRSDIIQISMSGYGELGPFRAYLGYGPPAAALSGLFGLTGIAAVNRPRSDCRTPIRTRA